MICCTDDTSPPNIGYLILDCKYNRITFVDCRRVVTLAVAETVTKVCDDHRPSPLCLASKLNAPVPASEASTCTTNSREKSRNCRLGECVFHFCVRLIDLRTQTFSDVVDGLILRRATSGVKMPASSGINFCTRFPFPSTDLNSLIVLGVAKLTIFFTQSSPIRIASAVSTCPTYFTSRGPNCTIDGFRVMPVFH